MRRSFLLASVLAALVFIKSTTAYAQHESQKLSVHHAWGFEGRLPLSSTRDRITASCAITHDVEVSLPLTSLAVLQLSAGAWTPCTTVQFDLQVGAGMEIHLGKWFAIVPAIAYRHDQKLAEFGSSPFTADPSVTAAVLLPYDFRLDLRVLGMSIRKDGSAELIGGLSFALPLYLAR